MTVLEPGHVPLLQLSAIRASREPCVLSVQSAAPIAAAHAALRAASQGARAVYGVNTGFGKLAHIRIPADWTELLQRNLILSHCCGVGPPSMRPPRA